ncbi:MAG: hypothetical protein CMB80_17165 [Flammeovirgaceae bacterium]|nr:hypothetical protein [Flammeovirgaceae bacterium]|tara:strand:+ start:423 stop:878 length:456 start_codon:yes stop_codon:yes gene_type:complete
MAINDRISDLISDLDTNPNSFADKIGVKSPVIYNIIKGRRSKPSYDLLQKILITYGAINANWLLKGEGPIWKENKDSIALDQGYESIENRIISLVDNLRTELGLNPSLEELSELIRTLLKENMHQRNKIQALYTKQDKILELLRNKLSLDL